MGMKKAVWGIGLVFFIAVLVMVVTVVRYDKEQTNGNVSEPYRTTLSGEYVCLPHVDTTGPQTAECASGIKTTSGEYYAIDLLLSSQMYEPLIVGEIISANGVVTPLEQLSANTWQQYPIVGIFSVTDSLVVQGEDNEPVACTEEAKICPDGSAVGRTGPNCAFAPCPNTDSSSAVVTTSLGKNATALSVTVSPIEIVSDSRCPSDVTCVWAGTVEVRTSLATPVAHGEQVLKLGEGQPFGEYTVTLIAVTPAKTQAEISDAEYIMTFEITK